MRILLLLVVREYLRILKETAGIYFSPSLWFLLNTVSRHRALPLCV